MNHHQLKDEELIRMHLSTEQSNYFETLYNRYVSKVYRRCLSLIKDTTKAEDFTHDIFLRVHGNLGNFREQATFSTWLYSISYNYCMDQLRSASRTALVEIGPDYDRPVSDNTEQELLEIQFQRLALILQAISPDETEMLRMKYEDGFDIRAIASHFSLKESAVKMRLKRTRDKVRRMYSQQYLPQA